MIPHVEIREFARKNGVPESTIERDYAQNWLLSSLPDVMTLKGGTGIRKVYIKEYRFSDDLDFTVVETVEADTLRELIVNAVREAKRKSGIHFDENVIFNEVKNGYEAVIYFRILRRTGSPFKIKIDMTKKENEIIILPLEKRKIIHPYSDDCNAEILSYSIKEIFAEKIRTVFQRTRPRDLYDVWYLSRVGLDVSNVLSKKFEFKRIEPNIDELSARKEHFRNAWKNALRHQLKDLPIFDAVFEDVVKFLRTVIHVNTGHRSWSPR